MRSSLRTRVAYASAAAALLFAAPFIVTATAGRHFLYLPVSTKPPPRIPVDWRLEEIPLDGDGGRIVVVVRPPEISSAPWVVHFHGQAATLWGSLKAIEDLYPGRQVGGAAFGYPGYDGSTGVPTEATIKSSALRVVSYLEERHGVNPKRLILLGVSLGTGTAAFVAHHLAQRGTPPAATLLLSPFLDMGDLFTDRLRGVPVGLVAPDRWRTDLLLPDLPDPIVVLHGDADDMIPFAYGEELARRLGSRATLVRIPGGSHRGLYRDPHAQRAARELLADVRVRVAETRP